MDIEVRRLGPGDEGAVQAARRLFDAAPQPDATQRFLLEPAHHLLVAYDEAGTPVGFVSGVERRSYPVLTWQDRRSTARLRPPPLLPSMRQ